VNANNLYGGVYALAGTASIAINNKAANNTKIVFFPVFAQNIFDPAFFSHSMPFYSHPYPERRPVPFLNAEIKLSQLRFAFFPVFS